MLLALEIAAALGTGVVGGIFYAFSTFVMRALARLPAEQGVAAMQAINAAVLNPLFFLAFFGTAAICAGLAVGLLLAWPTAGAACGLAGSALYLAGTIGVTMRFNVPLNLALDVEGVGLWPRYVRIWTRWNHLRTAAALAASVLFVVALWLQGGSVFNELGA